MDNGNNLTTSGRIIRKALPWGRLIFFLIIMLIASRREIEVKAQEGITKQNAAALAGQPEEKLSFRLQLLAQPVFGAQDIETQAQQLSLPASGPGSLLRNEAGEILVYIRLNSVAAASLDALAKAGAKIVHIAAEYRTVTAYIGSERLLAVATVAGVESLQEELTPQLAHIFIEGHKPQTLEPARPQTQADCTSAITSEGYTQLAVGGATTAYGVSGNGVTVGILSDSYNKPASALSTNAADDIASGDLPGAANPCGRTTPVNVIKEGPAGLDEGRAMLQIVHDLAPGANLAFASAFYGLFDFADQIRALRNAGADVIADDVFYFPDPFFQDGPITEGIKDVTSNGGLYFTLAGNHHKVVNGQAVGSYEVSAYRPMTCPAVTFISQGDCHDFNPGAGTDNTYRFTLLNGGKLSLDFQWAEPWYGVQTDIDIYLVNNSNSLLAQSFNGNPGTTQTPYEFFTYTNTSGSTQAVNLIIHRFSGTATPRLKYILLQSTSGLSSVEYDASNSTDIFGPTIYGHSGANEAMSVAAVPFNNSNSPESYTSRGFPTYYFGPVTGTTPAAPLTTPETRQKPDFGATDGGRNTFFGSFDGINFRFYGTSAAAPHAAAVGALMIERANQLDRFLDRSIAESILEGTTTVMSSGSTQANGTGLINALDATTSNLYAIPLENTFLPVVLKN